MQVLVQAVSGVVLKCVSHVMCINTMFTTVKAI